MSFIGLVVKDILGLSSKSGVSMKVDMFVRYVSIVVSKFVLEERKFLFTSIYMVYNWIFY